MRVPIRLEHAAIEWVTEEELLELELALAPCDRQYALFRCRATASEAAD